MCIGVLETAVQLFCGEPRKALLSDIGLTFVHEEGEPDRTSGSLAFFELGFPCGSRARMRIWACVQHEILCSCVHLDVVTTHSVLLDFSISFNIITSFLSPLHIHLSVTDKKSSTTLSRKISKAAKNRF